MEELAQKVQEVRDGELSPTEERELYEEFEHISQQHVNAVTQCGECDECMFCGFYYCQYNDPLHFHHDGCPSCWSQENTERVNLAFDQIAVERKLSSMSLDSEPDHEMKD